MRRLLTLLLCAVIAISFVSVSLAAPPRQQTVLDEDHSGSVLPPPANNFYGECYIPVVYVWGCDDYDTDTCNNCPTNTPYGQLHDKWHFQHSFFTIYNPQDSNVTIPTGSIHVYLYDKDGNQIYRDDIHVNDCWYGTTNGYMIPQTENLEPGGTLYFAIDPCLVNHSTAPYNEVPVTNAKIVVTGPMYTEETKFYLRFNSGWEMHRQTFRPGSTSTLVQWTDAGTLEDDGRIYVYDQE